MKRALTLSGLMAFAMTLVLCFVLKVRAAGPTFASFDFPSAAGLTEGRDINNNGEVVGTYIDSSGIHRGFLLNNGAFTSITFPPAAVWTRANGINKNGDIVGEYSLTDPKGDANVHGYLLRGGSFFSFDFPGAAATLPEGIDTNGDIVGWYTTNAGSNSNGQGSSNTHGFLMSNGEFTSIDFPDATSTQAWKINDHAEILGKYMTSTDDKWHLFYRLGGGSLIPIADFPGAAETAPGTYAHIGGLNLQGDIASVFCSSTPCQNIFNFSVDASVHSFLLSGGTYTSFDPPNAVGSIAFGINDTGNIVGTFRDSSGLIHGYLRTP